MNRQQKRNLLKLIALGSDRIEINRMFTQVVIGDGSTPANVSNDMDVLNAQIGRLIKAEKMVLEIRPTYAYCTITTKDGIFKGEGRDEQMARLAALVYALPVDPIVIKGVGFESRGGGFASLRIDDKDYSLEQIAAALNL